MRYLLRAFAFLLVWAALPAFSQSTPIRVGFIGPISGAASDFGTSARLGMELAIAEINEVGGYVGRPFELLVRDDQGKPDQGRKHAEELVHTEKVAFTVAGGGSGAALAMLDVFQTNQHLLVVGMATATAITQKYASAESYIFRMAASDSLQAAFLVDEVLKKGYRRVALFADKTGYGEGGVRDVEKFLAEKGLKPAYVARFDVGVPSLKDEMERAKAAGADVVISYTVGPEQALIAKARIEAKYKAPQYAPWTASSRVVWKNGGKAVNGLVFVQTFIQDLSNERKTSFIARLNKQAAGQPIHSVMAAAQHYDAMHLMLRVIFQTKGDLAGPALKNALENLQRPYAGALTTHVKPFSPADHEAFTKNMTWLAVWRDGQIHFLSAEDAMRASYIRRKDDR